MTVTRPDGRELTQLRPIDFVVDIQPATAGSVLIKWGGTHVICSASIEDKVPNHRLDSGGGWITAEYAMLPGSSGQRIRRDRSGVKGRTAEIQRLIGRSLRAAFDLDSIGHRTLRIDCDVLNADGGTRCASITGSYVAASIALHRAFAQEGRAFTLPPKLAAVSVGVVDGRVVTDLCYDEDHRADVDLNFVATQAGIVEIQGTAEGRTFSESELSEMLNHSRGACEALFSLQGDILKEATR